MQKSNAIKDTTRNIDVTLIILAIIIVALFALLVSYSQLESLVYFFGGLLALVAAAIIYFQPQFGGYLLVVTAFSTISDIVVANGYPSITKPLLAVILVSVVANNIFRRRETSSAFAFNLTRVEIFLFAYLLISWASIPLASDKAGAVSEGIDLIKELLIVFAIVLSLVKWDYWKRAIWLVLIVVFALALIGSFQSLFQTYDNDFLGFGKIYEDYIDEYQDQYRISGPLDDPNYWGMVLVSVIPLGVYRFLDEKNLFVKGASLMMTGVIAFALLNTYSRGAFVALVVSAILILIEKRLSLPLMLLILLGAVLIFAFAPSGYFERVETLTVFVNPSNTGEIYQDSSFRGRYSELVVGIQMFMDHPMFGVGIGNYATNYIEYARFVGIETRYEEREPHSLYVELLAETGIFGLLVFFGLVYNLINSLVQLRKFVLQERLYKHWGGWISSIMISLITYLVTSIFLHGAYIRFFWVFFGLALAILQIGKKIRKFDKQSMALVEN